MPAPTHTAHLAPRTFAVASRSDSTLRGHYPAEIEALRRRLGEPDAEILVPAFFEGGRLTVGDIHWVREARPEGDWVVPAGQTEFARDPVFGYTASNLRHWAAEKTAGRVPADQVVSVSLSLLRREGPDGVTRLLSDLSGNRTVIVNATEYADLLAFTLGLLRAEAAGKRFLYRTAASFVRVRGGVTPRGLLSRDELLGAKGEEAKRRKGEDDQTVLDRASSPHQSGEETGGLVVVGSYVQRSSEQLAALMKAGEIEAVELAVPAACIATGGLAELVAPETTAIEAVDRDLTLHGLRMIWEKNQPR